MQLINYLSHSIEKFKQLRLEKETANTSLWEVQPKNDIYQKMISIKMICVYFPKPEARVTDTIK